MKLQDQRLLGIAVRLSRFGGVAALALVAAFQAPAAELVVADFNGAGFDYTFDGFIQTPGPSSVRLTDPFDNNGGAGLALGGMDLSTLADGRLVVDVTPLAANTAVRFDVELIDRFSAGTTSRSGKWSFDVSGLTPGAPVRLVSANTVSSPLFGVGDFGDLDLSQVLSVQVLGDYSGQSTFDFEFDRIAVSTDVAAPPPYPGAEPDAPWRAVASSRIEANRKADLAVSVVDLAGNPVPGASVQASMQAHEFGFGSAVQAGRLASNSSQHTQYKNITELLFNVVTLENSLKWQAWEGEFGSFFGPAQALGALDWLEAAGIDARGHALIWPGVANLPGDIQQLLADGDLSLAEQTTVRARIAGHFADITSATAGKVVAWDVVNETRTNNDLMRELIEGDNALVDWFNMAGALAGETDLFLNDFGILNSSGSAPANRQTYYDTVQFLKDEGAPIEGIGFQGHFLEGDITGPEQLWAIVDQFADLDLSMQVTEFDFATTDEELQARYTADFLTAMFAHEGIDDILLWGFWEDAHWRPDAALFRSDWSIKPNGEAFIDLIYNQWWTDESMIADSQGETLLRGFKGDYLVTASAGGEEVTESIVLADGGDSIVITLPFLVGDYNGDGSVDAADYTVWRDTLGQSGPGLAADADGNGVIDQADFLLWSVSFGAASSTFMAVPEPGTVYIAASLLTLSVSMLRRNLRR